MDGGKTPLNHSLQRELNRWILAATLVFSVLIGVISAWIAFDEARELQDNQLQQVATVVATQMMHVPIPDNDPEDTLILQRLGETTAGALPIPLDVADGLHTLHLPEISWRVCVYSKANGRFAVSQQTEVRDEIAWDSSLRTVLPIILLAPLLMVVTRLAINRGFQSIHALATTVDNHNEARLSVLPMDAIPLEIQPFINSINQLLMRLHQAMTQQQRFVADAAHELRTPITALSLLAENLTNATTLAETHTRLIPVQTGLNRMRTLVTQLLDLARLQGGNLPRLVPVELHTLLQQTIADLYPLAEAKAIDLGILHSEPATVLGQPHLLTALMRNALENAIRYTPQHGRVDVKLFTQNGQAILQVMDTGSGIPQTELRDVFKPFYRVSNHHEQGSGLGLAISQEIAQHLQGTITLTNQTNGGLQFEYKQRLLLT